MDNQTPEEQRRRAMRRLLLQALVDMDQQTLAELIVAIFHPNRYGSGDNAYGESNVRHCGGGGNNDENNNNQGGSTSQ